MAEGNGTTTRAEGVDARASDMEEIKGKGKAPSAEVDHNMIEEDDDDDDDDDDEDQADEPEEEEEDDDNMEEIDPSNIITTGRRTRGKAIDFAKAAENANDLDDDEDEDDEDFQAPDDAMQE